VLGEAEIEAIVPRPTSQISQSITFVVWQCYADWNTSWRGLSWSNRDQLRSIFATLGPNRTLVLLDGQRVGGSTVGGFLWMSMIFRKRLLSASTWSPAALPRPMVPTAVAGVVNFVLDKDFTGLKGELVGRRKQPMADDGPLQSDF